MAVIGLLHPGAMGSAVGRCLVAAGHQVLWASEGRGAETRARAAAAALTDAGGIRALASQVDVLLSVCPPHAALEVARQVAAAGFTGTFVDANAIAPATARQIGTLLPHVVDGGIIGSPPAKPGSTRLYLSGDGAQAVAGLFAGSALDARVLDGPAGAASALKMAYAAWTKGSSALLLTARALAQAEGVDAGLLAEWQSTGLDKQVAQAEASAKDRGWRWVGEMEEIAASMAAHGLPDGFHRAAAKVYSSYPRP